MSKNNYYNSEHIDNIITKPYKEPIIRINENILYHMDNNSYSIFDRYFDEYVHIWSDKYKK